MTVRYQLLLPTQHERNTQLHLLNWSICSHMIYCDIPPFTFNEGLIFYAPVSSAVITVFVTTLHNWGGRPFPGNCYLPISFCLQRIFLECNRHLGLHPCVRLTMFRKAWIQQSTETSNEGQRKFSFLSLFDQEIHTCSVNSTYYVIHNKQCNEISLKDDVID